MSLHTGTVKVVATLPSDHTHCTSNTVRVSPDGKRIAWVQGSTSDNAGTFMIANIDGSGAKQLATQVSCLGATAIIWPGADVVQAYTAKGGKLAFHYNGQKLGGDPGEEKSAVWSDKALAIAARDGETGGLYSAVVAGHTLYKITYAPPADQAEHWDGFSPRSVSENAQFVAFGWNGTDPSREDGSFVIVNANTSKPVTLPEGSIAYAELLPNGTAFVKSAATTPTLEVLDNRWHVIASSPLPDAVAHLTLVRYVP